MTVQTHRIDSLGAQGDGVAAGPLYAAFTLPGELARGRREGERLVDIEIIAPSPARVTPRCPHFGACGGCALQHAADDFLAAWKTAQIAAALAARGLSAPMRPIAVSPPGSRRRVALSGRRTRKGALVGFHARASATLVAVETCPVADPAIVAALPALADLAGLTASRSGEARLVVATSTAGLDVALDAQRALDGPLRAALAAAAAQADLARLSYNGEALATRRPPAQVFGRARVAPPPGGFLQATQAGEAALLAAVREAVAGCDAVADLFAGSGTFALPLAEAASVHAVEGDAAAAAALDAGWRQAQGLRAVSVEARDLFRRPLAPPELARFSAAVFDPPWQGAAAQAAALAASGLTRIAAVSCNPASFARDARTLVDAGFRLDWVQPVDQFRWSAHVELAAAFSR